MVPTSKSPVDAVTPAKKLGDFDPLLADYRGSSLWSSCWQLVSTVTLFIISWTLMYYSLTVSYWLTLALAVPTALLLVRLFILQHDCGHRSFFASKRANDVVGWALGLLTFTPYDYWRRKHAMHHACSGDLDRRGKSGEILTMTVEEYLNASPWQRLGYRLYRHPFVLFGIGAFYHFVIGQRFTWRVPPTWKKERRGIHVTNALLLGLALALGWLIGPWQLFLIEVPVVFLGAGIGVWLFYMQHQYEDAFWARGKDWNYVTAALSGSSYYHLPKILQWFTASIGLHHIHHLDARIPNYRLQQCYDSHPVFRQAHEFSLRDSISCVNAKLWDEVHRKMVGFDAVQLAAANKVRTS